MVDNMTGKMSTAFKSTSGS